MVLLMGIDAGQSATKAVIFDENLTVVSESLALSKVHYRQGGFAERSHQEVWQATADAIAGAVKIASDVYGSNVAKRISAVGVSGHGDGLYLLDEVGCALGPGITAMDSRASDVLKNITDSEDANEYIKKYSGQQALASSPGTLLAWKKAYEKDEYKRISTIFSCKDLIRYKLTGEISSEFSDACSSFLNIYETKWDEKIAQSYGVEDIFDALPKLNWAGDFIGKVNSKAADECGLMEGTPVIAGMHDVQAAALGMGALRKNSLSMVAGSFNTNAVASDRAYTHKSWQCRVSVTEGLYLAMATSPTASPVLNWVLGITKNNTYKKHKKLLKSLDKNLSQQNLPIIFPFMVTSPYGIPGSGGVFDLNINHGKKELYLAAIESVVFMHMWHIDDLAKKYSWHNKITVSGGIANNKIYLQTLANATNKSVFPVLGETGCRGAAMAAAVSKGIYENYEEVQAVIEQKREYLPESDNYEYLQNKYLNFRSLCKVLFDSR